MVVLSDTGFDTHIAGDESTTIASEYRLGIICRPDTASQARATGGKQRSLHKSAKLMGMHHIHKFLNANYSCLLNDPCEIKSDKNKKILKHPWGNKYADFSVKSFTFKEKKKMCN